MVACACRTAALVYRMPVVPWYRLSWKGRAQAVSHGHLCAWVLSFDYTAGKSGKKGRPALQFLLLFAVFLMKYLCSEHSGLINSNSDVNISQH